MPDEPYMLGIVIADVADKGVPAALMMALSKTIIRTISLSGRSPMNTFYRANEIMLNDSSSEMFVTGFYGKLDTQTGWFTFCNAGHNPPLWYRAELGEFQPLALKGIVLGILDDIELDEETISVATDDLLIFYTDGVNEALNPEGEEFGMERFMAIIAEHVSETTGEITQAVLEALMTFCADTPQHDDFTLVVVKRE